MTRGAGRGWAGRSAYVWAVITACVLGVVTACAGPGGTDTRAHQDEKPGTASTAPAGGAEPGDTTRQPPQQGREAEPQALKGARLNVREGQVVGVGMPLSVTFDRPVPRAERARVEEALKVRSAPAAEGAWSWVKDRNLLDGQRIDYRPREFHAPGTRITVSIGSRLTRSVAVGRSLVATVDVRRHEMKVVTASGERRIPITAGAPGMDTWNGTMVVSDKQRRVLMDSRTVGYGDAYKDYYDYAVHLTASGTYLHQNPKADQYAGRSNVTHGCIGLATDGTARRFYEQVIPGDVIRVVGSKETVAPGNGYGDWNLSWDQWRAGSALT
ncbi:L,D-transpeptidase [Streptomyces sp. M41]|uniref:L,D-transpeptidase n=1 Tax=Streptomyces sp. M41 TaxID=3059412 RepID=UPI00374D9791